MPVAPPARTAFNRATALHRLAEGPVDVLVVGGGITGAGVALDAASRGLRTALVEQADLASGTSSRSSKLVHGGLRYLQQRQFGLVHEALTERQRLLRNAPHLVHPLAFLIPLLGRRGRAASARGRTVSAGLWVYDLAGGVRIGHRHHRVNRSAALGHVPTLRADRLLAAWRYHDAHTDDARLTLAIARTAALDHGAMVVTHAPVTSFLTDARGNVRGATLHVEGEGDLDVGAGVVVNATGVWADHLEASHPGRPAIRPAKGIHLTVPAAALPCDLAVVLPVPGEERTIFAVPWGDQVYLGTTDTDYQGSLDQPRATAADISYLLDAVNAWVERPLSAADVTGVWA
ncbi:MAG TPA: glycerol-3-phosphate dehydrogenase/oxidase, partial [Acidimicrobiales bacterium]|nr:glycerol-3-phosphate dehydrogenase/oxidase [Acidimicrobiales bacterium]